MESAYDRKFEEMKKYIPFLESMIKRLESTSLTSTNPRQAQLDKIRSLRDLLLDKNKRMKMENLLKCEQVLVNLYAKVEQKDPFSNIKPSSVQDTTTSKEKNDLETVRNKLKTVAKIQEGVETLPEIARANDIELDYTGSKEPALFQRRPNRSPPRPSQKPHIEPKTKSPQGQRRRSYTRVLQSPDRSPLRWSSSEQSASEKPLFSRRSPAPPKVMSPLTNKKGRKMFSKTSKLRKTNDLNITLNVPEKSLNSLNTKDILSRILNCSDGDVDIDTLRGLRSQILGELKQTGKNDDISDLILKSYNKKSKPVTKTRRTDDVEEGELSDSESEAIESIYGSLVVVDKDKKSLTQEKTIDDKDNQQRKIQICLVINSDKSEIHSTNKGSGQPNAVIDLSEFEMFSESEGNQSKDISLDSATSLSSPSKKNTSNHNQSGETTLNMKNADLTPYVNSKTTKNCNEIVTIEDDEIVDRQKSIVAQTINNKQETIVTQRVEESILQNKEKKILISLHSNEQEDINANGDAVKSPNKKDTQTQNETDSYQKENFEQLQENPEQSQKFIANFYKPIEERRQAEPIDSAIDINTVDENRTIAENPVNSNGSVNVVDKNCSQEDNKHVTIEKIHTSTKESASFEKITDDSQKIPLLNEPTVPPKAKTDVLSEIDILQALKNEILSDSIAMPGSEAATPALHQPKLTKVASAQEVMPKKRISIEKYKQKASISTSKPLFVKKRNRLEESKKQSLKLTEKECERFNFPKRMSFDSDDVDEYSEDDFMNDDKDSLGLDDIYGDLAPKSPDNETCNENTIPPVIIPMDPVKAPVVSSKADVDMRPLLQSPQLQPAPVPAPVPPPLMSLVIQPSPAYSMPDANLEQSKKDRISAMDPRMRRDLNSSVNSPNPYAALNSDRTPRSVAFPSMTPSRTPNMTPSYMPSIPLLMTPNTRPFEMTPSHQSFELEESSSRKHVYAPSFSICDNRERESSVAKDAPQWEINKNDPRSRRSRWEDSNISAGGQKWEDRDSRSNFGQTEVPGTPRYDDSYKSKYEKYNNRLKNDKYSVDRRDSYSKSDCPTTPIPSFGWSECPPTPSNTFGRQEAPMTPSQSFGRSECPSTPSHSFGRSECPTTPIHPFGRADCPQTPGSVFGRQEYQPPSLSYSRSECPSTPSHSFGRSDCPPTPSHPFGRPETLGRPEVNNSSNQKYNKDPRLNRRPLEYESSYSERDRDNQSERSHGSSPYVSRNYEKDCDRISSIDRSTRQYDRNRREPSLGRSLSRDSERDRLYTRNRESRNDSRHSRSYDDVSRREHRERGIGRTSEDKNNLSTRSISRASSVGRSLIGGRDKDNISLKSDTGRDLTINTSVESSFQIFQANGKPIQVFDYTFDSRRRRATSVGRSLVRESSVDRTVSTAHKRNENSSLNRNNKFKRASSMGRELANTRTDRTFQEVKADFESYRSKTADKSQTHKKVIDEKRNNEMDKESNKHTVGQIISRHKIEDTIRLDKKYDQINQPYSPRRNNRDPRMRNKRSEEHKNRYKIDRRVYPRDREKSGIVYSNDNIAKGTIMGSGFGVKNYKIPKIKRPEPEVVEVQKEKESSDKNVVTEKKIEQSDSDKKPLQISKPVEDTLLMTKKETEIKLGDDTCDLETRVTRSKNKVDINKSKNDLVGNSRKYKKPVIYDTESDSGTDKELNESNESKNRSKLQSPIKKTNKRKEPIVLVSPLNVKEVQDKSNERLDSNFGIDDMEIFTENIGSDPVIENINALIADLDNDLDSSKITNVNFSTDIEMLDTINSLEDNSLGDISEVIEKDLNESNELQKNIKEKESISSLNTKSIDSEEKRIHKNVIIENPTNLLSGLTEDEKMSDNTTLSKVHEAIVSTTEIDRDSQIDQFKMKNAMDVDCKTADIPDSTIHKNVSDKTDDGLPDSTNDIHCELSSDVTSTYNTAETAKKDADSQNSQKDTFNSIGSLLSILQDKSKIKELLSMLGGQSSENEKIKKKLEKLSEIVSDEEDKNEETKKVDLKEELVDIKGGEDRIQNIKKKCIDDQVDQKDETIGENIVFDNKLEKNDKFNPEQNIITNNSDTTDSKLNEAMKETKEKAQTVYEPEINQSGCITVLDSKEVNKNNVTPEEQTTEKVGGEGTGNAHILEDNEELDDDMDDEPLIKTKKKGIKKTKARKSNRRLKPAQNKTKPLTQTPVTDSSPVKKPVNRKSTSRELQKLQEDIKEMFMSDDILKATGIRMCRLAKMVTDTDDRNREILPDSEPIVVLDKVKGIPKEPVKIRKKPGPKPKVSSSLISLDKKTKSPGQNNKMDDSKGLPKYKPGPKCKSKQKNEDPYEFDADSVTDTNTTKGSDEDSSDSDNESLASSRSFGSSEVIVDKKNKPKRKRRGTRGWQSGIIKPKNKKKKEQKHETTFDDFPVLKPQKPITIPDLNCFTDKTYCFQKGVSTYDCRLCVYSGTDIITHYKKQHPHTEIPLSRMDTRTAELAIQQCEEINFQAISKIPSDRYTCRFCRKEFGSSRMSLETFFWHIVSSHTGEFKQLCSECVNITRCPFNLDIPPPPKDGGQLIGYLCGKCNFTQISLENLKTHVIVRHNDEETEVYTINLALMSKKAINALVRRSEAEQPRVLRNLRSNQSASDVRDYRDDQSDTTESSRRNSHTESDSAVPGTEDRPEAEEQKQKQDRIKTKLTFENDEPSDEPSVKMEEEDHEAVDRDETSHFDDSFNADTDINLEIETPRGNYDDIVDYPHFKLNYTDSGAKEYVCCINGNDSHYKTALMISMKKHVQSKHSEKWDGYCCLCKVIVTLQGVKSDFKDCLTHFLDKHMDDFPVVDKVVETVHETVLPVTNLPSVGPELPPSVPASSLLPARVMTPPVERTASPSYIAVRPLAELISKELVKEIEAPAPVDTPIPFPKIENVVSLGDETENNPPPAPSPVYPTTVEPASQPEKPYLYEEVQAEVMSKKHRVVLDGMMSKENLVRVFKCAGRFCSFTSDSPEDALLHASTHQRIGGEGALNCAYCNYDACANGIDLVMHVFKEHSNCQFCCPMCFYRSAASQLVGVHYLKAHGVASSQKNVLRSTAAVPPPAPGNCDILMREVAVKYYICNHDDGACNFRTYTPGKFIEHLQQKHGTAASHPCNLCEQKFPTPPALVVHLRSHGLRLYQCTWCVHGANNETELLSHAAARHPHCQPQAYVRVITNMDGSAQRRVLPLAYLNKSKVLTEEVTPNTTKDNPVREAERSIELERLISQTMMMFEASTSQNSQSPAPEIITDEIISEDSIDPVMPDVRDDEQSTLEQHLVSTSPVTQNTTVASALQSGLSTTTTIETPVMEEESVTDTTSEPVLPNTEQQIGTETNQEPTVSAEKTTEKAQESLQIKSEPSELLKDKLSNEIICLDSDEEESNTMAEATPVNTTVENNKSDNIEATKTDTGDVSRNRVTDEVSITKIPIDKPTSTISIDENLKQHVIDLSDDEPPSGNAPIGLTKVGLDTLFRCPHCSLVYKTAQTLRKHVKGCSPGYLISVPCPHKPCSTTITGIDNLIEHYIKIHRDMNAAKVKNNQCGVCNCYFTTLGGAKLHIRMVHKIQNYDVTTTQGELGQRRLTVNAVNSGPPRISGRKTSTEIKRYGMDAEPPNKRTRKISTEIKKRYGIDDIDKLPISPILDTQVYCELCEFGTKVRLNLVRHLQQHAGSKPVPRTEPVNPVPHLETNEKHFDKMVNLASSSVLTRAPDKPVRQDVEPAVNIMIPAAESSRYPKYVPERQRYTCGAKGCTYISVDMAMFRRHWETLHAGTEEYRCVHCPPNQALDTSIPLTATRILAHLRMHDVSLYACSVCSYYHYRNHLVEKHATETHKEGSVKIVREEYLATTSASQPPTMGAPTMDLKAWQCGLCKFNSMLRPEVVNHCGAQHQSKMQFKCAYCPFRTSTKENVVKHQSNAHANKAEEIFYYFYREGSIPDADGVPLWQKQRQKLGLDDSEVKTEPEPSIPAEQATLTPITIAPIANPVSIDLNLVKKETDELNPDTELTQEGLLQKFGQYCDPDGIKYKCSLCNIVREHKREAMQCHLYEELNYRRWECAMCTYKAFHKTGLNDHMFSEHSRQYVEPRALPIDVNIEKWVCKLLDHQTKAIEMNKQKLQKMQVERVYSAPASPRKVASPKPTLSTSDAELEQAFGSFGAPIGQQFSCPKCEFTMKEEIDMRYHLESELTKIRWGCTYCPNKFQTFHEAQFHCKSAHTGHPSRPKEAIRDPSLRSGWISAVITAQKQAMKADTSVDGLASELSENNVEEESDPNENSLLVARYDEPVTTEEQLAVPAKRAVPSADSDEEILVIDEVEKKKYDKKCPFCEYTSTTPRCVKEHILRHYNIKPFKCGHCPFDGGRVTVLNHLERIHPGKPKLIITMQIPKHLPPDMTLKITKRDTTHAKDPDDVTKVVCLYCEKSVAENETESHTHGNDKPEFAKRGALVVKCCKCLALRLTITSLQEHFDACHPSEKFNYAYFKLQIDTREIHCCGHCYKKFKFLIDLKAHHIAIHSSLSLAYTSIPFNHNLHTEDTDTGKRKMDDGSMPGPSPKRVARKSTTKLPSSALAKKSTTKLPMTVSEEFSYYGTKPLPVHQYKDVTFNMPMYNTMVEIDVNKLSGILKIDPKVVIRDCQS